MSIYTKIEDSLYTAISKAFETLGKNVRVVLSHQNGPEPKGDYVSINVLSMEREGSASKSGMAAWENNQAKEYSVQAYDSLVQLNFFGDNAPDLATLFHSQWKSNTAVREHFLRNNLAPRIISGLRRAPQLRDTVWINSFAVDIRVGYAVRTIQDVDWVDRVVINDNNFPIT